ncbi:DsbA family protein [Patulibacter americanus]|uniref:DsbA family protein n=1 Tax=Patulibacter americanus TaxID=588672 RepID=UPI0003B7268E|nr:DsbA family protein [Patulibacter americanus]
MTAPLFLYEFSSPYAYFSAHRINGLMPMPVRWQPILFGALAQSIGKVPWSLQLGAERDRRMRDCEERAAALGLPLTWPRDWPLGTYSVLAARAALAAGEQGLLREFSLEAFRVGLGLGQDLTDPEVVWDAARAVGADVDALAAAVERPDLKAALRDATETAARRGVTGVPTVEVGAERFWGDDRLEDAARALGASAD